MARRAKGEGSLIKRKGCRLWYASFYDAAGRQIRKSTGTDVRQKALAKLRMFMGKTESGTPLDGGKLKYSDLRAALLANYVEKGNKSLETRADGSETIVGLPQLDAYCGYKAPANGDPGSPGLPAARLNTDMARDFVKKRKAEGTGEAMINRSLQCLRRMLRIAHEDNKIAVVPKIRLQKEPGARQGFLGRVKFEELLAALPSHLRTLIALLYWCGVRKGEALQIDWSQVDLEIRTITLSEEQTKNSEPRVIPLPSEVVGMLRGIEPKVGSVFDGSNLRVEWEKACAAVGLGERTLMESKQERHDRKEPRIAKNKWYQYRGLIVHDLRRSAVRNLRLAGVPENVAMKISGHKTRSVFDRYNIVSTEDVRAAMQLTETSAAKALPPVSAKSVQKPQQKSRKTLQAVKSKGAGA